MTELNLNYFVAAGLLLLANAFFVAVEFALVSLRRTKIEEFIRAGRRGAIQVREVLEKLEDYLSTCQVGITLASLGLGWIGERTFAALFYVLFTWLRVPHLFRPLYGPDETATLVAAHTVALVLAFLMITFLHVVLGEQAPKIFALHFPEGYALWTVWPMKLFNRLFWPLVWTVNASTRFTLRGLGLKPLSLHARVHSVEELGMILDESRLAGVVSAEERRMLQRVFRFHDKTVKAIMVPRLDIVALNIRAKEEEVTRTFFESGYSRLPVYEGGLDRIVGIIYVKDLLYTFQHPKLIKLVDLLREVPEIPESCQVSQLLRDFQKRRVHMAIVVDEFGATTGLVTLEDVVEEIVGEIHDEHDLEPELVERLADGTVLMDSMVQLDRFREVFPGVVLPEGDFDSVGGLVLRLAGRLPREGDSFRFGEFSVRVVKREGRRIRKVALRRIGTGPFAPPAVDAAAREALARSLSDEAAIPPLSSASGAAAPAPSGEERPKT